MPMFPPVFLANGEPHPGNALLNAVLIQSLYAEDPVPSQVVAAFYGGQNPLFLANPNSYPVDVTVITAGGQGLVAMAGTTNAPQWIGHMGGAVAAIPDPFVPHHVHGTCLVNPSFFTGCQIIESQVLAALVPIGSGPIRIAGHSYGGASAFVLGRHIRNAGPSQPDVTLVTMGAPKAYDQRAPAKDVNYHARIIATIPGNPYTSDSQNVDPVTQVPPSILQVARPGFIWNFVRKYLGFFWGHWGESYLLFPDHVVKTTTSAIEEIGNLLPSTSLVNVITNLPNVDLHLMTSSYLPKIYQWWRISGLSPELSFLFPFVVQYAGPSAPAPPILRPAVTAAQMNQSFAVPGTTPFTDADLAAKLWQSVSAIGYYASPKSSQGESGMSLMKMTMGFNTIQGGFTESLYSSNPADTIQTMVPKALSVLNARTMLSYTDNSGNCRNPIIPQFIRITDTLQQRASFDLSISGRGYSTFTLPPNSPILPAGIGTQNLDLELGFRVTYGSGASRQQASITHHGVPLEAFQIAATTGGTLNVASYSSTAFQREAYPNAPWLQAFVNYLNALINNGLGFRTIAGAWNLSNGRPGPYSVPNYVFYNASLQMVELNWVSTRTLPIWPTTPPQLAGQCPSQWPTGGSNPNEAPIGTLGSICRVQIRGWKEFQVLNGRWAAQVVAPQTGCTFALRILRQCRQLPGTQTTPGVAPFIVAYPLPQVSPIAWTAWVPGGGVTPPVTNLTTTNPSYQIYGDFDYIEAKKLGRDFELQRGRARNRPT